MTADIDAKLPDRPSFEGYKVGAAATACVWLKARGRGLIA
jgi:hypothetical protein